MTDTPDKPEAGFDDFRFGAIAVWGGLAEERTVDETLAEQKKLRDGGGKSSPIGEMLVKKKVLTEKQVRDILRVQLQRLPAEGHSIYGQIADVTHLVKREDIEQALDMQSREILAGGEVRRIGSILLEMGRIDEKTSEAILAFQATADGRSITQALHAKADTELNERKDAAASTRSGRTSPPVFLPTGVAGVISDNIIWILLGLASVTALILALMRDSVFG